MRLENCIPFGQLWSPVGPLWVQRAFNAASACIPRAIEFCIAIKLPLLLGDVLIDCKTSEARQEMSLPVGGLYLYEVLTESGFLYWF
jgi:hypothetical protein